MVGWTRIMKTIGFRALVVNRGCPLALLLVVLVGLFCLSGTGHVDGSDAACAGSHDGAKVCSQSNAPDPVFGIVSVVGLIPRAEGLVTWVPMPRPPVTLARPADPASPRAPPVSPA